MTGKKGEEDEDDEAPPLVDGTFDKAAKKGPHACVIEAKAKKFDTAEDVQKAIGSKELDLTNATSIKLSGNSYGFAACKWLSEQFISHGDDTPNLVDIDFSDIFVSRLRAELPKSLKVMAEAILPKHHLTHLNVSDNAFGPDGVKAFECLLKGMPSL